MKTLLSTTYFSATPFYAFADGRGSGDAKPKLSAQERAIKTLVGAIGKDAKAEAREEAARRKAIGELFTSFIEDADEDLVVAVFAGLEVPATKANRKRIAAHPLRPAKVDAIVEKRLAEIEKAKAEEAAERERLRVQDLAEAADA
ncbi:hypothetical protein [Jannaschia donghaensis]|uniref:Uncharacterized protein n=1 Tax=Jannaschia donghaensis TaxID=420998 RepID=A0A0M6YF02_9RHOB|nr:hypothetical protein [Jannaschia donghaensis]CTQ48103.1 hypothetical protein JDO7802_00105 [Jannaschia donghaensis]